jgi:pimeloyl-ACP methyl ester carboxylesterase
MFTAPGSGEMLLVDNNAWCAGLPNAMKAAGADPAIHQLYLEPSKRIGLRRTTLRMERLEGFAELLAPVPEALRRRRGPTAIVWGEDDLYFQNEWQRLQAHLPSASLTMISGGGHFPHEDRPDDVSVAICRILREER